MSSLCSRGSCRRSTGPRLARPRSAYSHLYDVNQSIMEGVNLLEDCLAVQLLRIGPTGAGPPQSTTHHYWMYDTGYLLFQGFLEANAKCFWDMSLVAAVRGLEYRGYVSPGVLFVWGAPCALEVIRTAWSRNTLRPPPNYTIALVGEVDGCRVVKVRQGGFTPLPDAVCWVILELGASGRTANLETIRRALASSFPAMEQPSSQIIYDTLADLMAYNKVYQTCQGYFVATPDSLRFVEGGSCSRSVLMSTAEAISMLHGEMSTIRQGSKTHQAIQTNLADVICGGNKNDKVLYGKVNPSKGSPGGTSGRKLERRHSMKMGGSSRRLASLHRAGSVRLLSNQDPNKKASLLSKLFKWTKKQPGNAQSNVVTAQSSAASDRQHHPQEWFNSTVLHRHSVATQTNLTEEESDWTGGLRPRRRSLSTSRLPRKSPVSRPSTPSSCKSPLYSSTPKALSSCASSGYNSLPRSLRARSKQNGNNVPKGPELTTTVDEASGVVTTTITNQNLTRIYLEQHTSPVRSIITVENGRTQTSRREPETSPSPSPIRRPRSVYSPEESSPVPLPLDKIKFPSNETIQLEEKLILSETNKDKNLKNSSNMSLKAGSLTDVNKPKDYELNNVKRPSISLNPIQPLSDKTIESLSFKNLLKDPEKPVKKEDNINLKISDLKISDNDKRDSCIKAFPSLGDVPLHFSSIAAQNILKGISSLDNLVDINLASEKSVSNVSYHTDLGIV